MKKCGQKFGMTLSGILILTATFAVASDHADLTIKRTAPPITVRSVKVNYSGGNSLVQIADVDVVAVFSNDCEAPESGDELAKTQTIDEDKSIYFTVTQEAVSRICPDNNSPVNRTIHVENVEMAQDDTHPHKGVEIYVNGVKAK